MALSVEGLAGITALSFVVGGLTRPPWLRFVDFPVPVAKVGLFRAVPSFVWLASSCGLEVWASAAVFITKNKHEGDCAAAHVPFSPFSGLDMELWARAGKAPSFNCALATAVLLHI
jgi:hypothetical protein